jgi:hypothetical protein
MRRNHLFPDIDEGELNQVIRQAKIGITVE